MADAALGSEKSVRHSIGPGNAAVTIDKGLQG